MQLKEFRALRKKTLEEDAAELKTTPATLSRWQNNKAIPGRDEMKRIVAWSRGAVHPNDFYLDPVQLSSQAGEA